MSLLSKTKNTSRSCLKLRNIFRSSSLLLLALSLLSGCGQALEISDHPLEKSEVIVYNWGEYIAEDTISRFEAAYPQYNVIYREFENNETMYPNLGNTYDIIIPSEYMVVRLIREGRLQALDYSLLPDVKTNMEPLFKDVAYDKDPELAATVLDYAVPYLYCTVGLMYDGNKVDLPSSSTDAKEIWGVLLDPAYRQQVGMYDSMRESIGMALNSLGYSQNSLDPIELEEAKALLLKQKKELSPTYGVDNLKDKLASGELAAAEAWSGDFQVVADRMEELGTAEKIDLQFALPEGANWSVDMMCIPDTAQNLEGAHAFINFMYNPEIALANSEYVGYSTPNIEAKALLPEEIQNNLSFYPDKDTFQSLELFFSDSEIEKTYINVWNTVKASS